MLVHQESPEGRDLRFVAGRALPRVEMPLEHQVIVKNRAELSTDVSYHMGDQAGRWTALVLGNQTPQARAHSYRVLPLYELLEPIKCAVGEETFEKILCEVNIKV